MLVFILFPILLLVLYPMRFFQQCLGCYRVRWHALHIFIVGTLQLHFSVHFSVPGFFFIMFALSPTVLFYDEAQFVFITLAMMSLLPPQI